MSEQKSNKKHENKSERYNDKTISLFCQRTKHGIKEANMHTRTHAEKLKRKKASEFPLFVCARERALNCVSVCVCALLFLC